MVNAYDEVTYPPNTFWQTHPDKLATHAIMFGVGHAPPDRCRYLEIGAGDGANIIPMAIAYPDSHFVGFDLAEEPVSRGRAIIKALGLANIELLQADILDVDLGEAPFDYIVAHGIYAWVSIAVRDKMMGLIGRLLAPQGVGYVSYNALPGGYFRLMIRNEMFFATRNVEGRAAQAEASYPALHKLIERVSNEGSLGEVMTSNAKIILASPASVLTHDILNDNYNPVHLYEFSNHCRQYGLQILTNSVPSEEFIWFSEDGSVDILEKAQHHDFTRLQFFHQSILVRDDVKIDRRLIDERLLSLYVSSPAGCAHGGGIIEAGDRLSVTDASLAAAIDKLAAIWPAAAKVADVIESPSDLAGLAKLYSEGRATFHALPTTYSCQIGERPMASVLSRFQAKSGLTRLTTLRHEMFQVDETMRDFLAGLDGSRTRLEIAREVAPEYDIDVETMLERLDVALGYLAKAPFLVE